MYEKIKNDPYIINIYNDIFKHEDENEYWAHHHLEHVLSVANMVEKILKDLNYEKHFIEEAKIAALLHDLGCIEGKTNHPDRSCLMAKKYFEENNIILENEDLVLEAIKLHSDGFETNNVMAQVLILCDKLDIKKDRLAKSGYLVDGIKEFQYIEDVVVDIKNMIIKIEVIADSKIDKTTFEKFYSISKVFKSIYAFSKIFEMDSVILFNGEPWKKPSE